MYEEVCRACLNKEYELKYIFEIDFNEIPIYNMFQNITKTEVQKDDNFPKHICVKCLPELQAAYNFQKKCIDSYKILQSKFLSNKINDEEVISNNCLDVKTEEFENFEENGVDIPDTNDHSYGKYSCGQCKRCFQFEKMLNEHKKRYTFECDQCLEHFSKLYYLENHKKIHVNKNSTNTINIEQLKNEDFTKPNKSQEVSFKCVLCQRNLLSAFDLKRHMRAHNKSKTNRKSHKCEICNKEFQFLSFLKEHMKNHTGAKPYLCSICGKGFRQKGVLKYHMRNHTGFKPFFCDICDEKFTTRGILKIHIRRHTGEKPFVCDVCGRSFRQSSDLHSHKLVHTGDKPIECSVCHKRMTKTGALTVHMRSHTGEKPHICAVCGKGFTTRTLMVRHERVHTGEKPYNCTICSRAFNQSSTMKTHMKTHNKSVKRQSSKKK